MTKLEQAVHDCLLETIDDRLADGIDRGEWLLSFNGQEYSVQYLPGTNGYHTRMLLEEPDDSDEGYTTKHRFIVEIKVTEIDLKD